MKMILLVAVLLVLFALIFPVVAAYSPPTDAEASNEPPDEPPDDARESSPFYIPPIVGRDFDSDFTVRLLDGDETREVTLDQYLTGAVAAEMPASFEPEALRAQAVALRTYLLHKLYVDPSEAHPSADICSDSTCCAAWKSEEFLREKWGADFEANWAKIRAAVTATDGMYLSYEDAPALAVFHSSSPGRTEESGEVWTNALPYLMSVESPETAEDVPNFVSAVTVSAVEFQETVSVRFPEASFSEDPAQWITGIVYDGSGRLHTAVIGGVTVRGTELRSLFGLRSAAVTFEVGSDAVTMTVTGYGHGVGMSQYGANVMAQAGATWQEILASYYPGTQLSEAKQ